MTTATSNSSWSDCPELFDGLLELLPLLLLLPLSKSVIHVKKKKERKK
jgi:hypothetical protein